MARASEQTQLICSPGTLNSWLLEEVAKEDAYKNTWEDIINTKELPLLLLTETHRKCSNSTHAQTLLALCKSLSGTAQKELWNSTGIACSVRDRMCQHVKQVALNITHALTSSISMEYLYLTVVCSTCAERASHIRHWDTAHFHPLLAESSFA